MGAIPGFDVTLGAWVPGDRHSYAVKNGAPTEAYDATEHAAIIRAGTPSYTFYLMNSGEAALDVDVPSVEVRNPAVAVSLSGDALTPGPLESAGAARSLVLDFSCAARAKSDVIVYLRVAGSIVAFGFRKVRARDGRTGAGCAARAPRAPLTRSRSCAARRRTANR